MKNRQQLPHAGDARRLLRKKRGLQSDINGFRGTPRLRPSTD